MTQCISLILLNRIAAFWGAAVAVVSKYVGETEQNPESVFGGTETRDAMLLVDEADALLGKHASSIMRINRQEHLPSNVLQHVGRGLALCKAFLVGNA